MSVFTTQLATRDRLVTQPTLALDNDVTSTSLITALADDPLFTTISAAEAAAIAARDAEDDDKLAVGIQLAIDKGVLTPQASQYKTLDVLGKSADAVAAEIIADLPKSSGFVLVLVGLSGTGKGTTVAKLKAQLPNAVTWSNGNIFRVLTLLAATHCEQTGAVLKDSLTPENLATWMGMLEFGKFGGAVGGQWCTKRAIDRWKIWGAATQCARRSDRIPAFPTLIAVSGTRK